MTPLRTPARFSACAVIPVYNHERAIGAVVDGVAAHGLHVFLVDDGSNEACAAELRRLNQRPDVTLLRHQVNRGKGVAVVTGLREARERGFSHALQVDADGQHTLPDIRRFLDEAQLYPDSVICGCPVFDASIPKARYYGRYLTHFMVWVETLSFDIRDSMCGFRLYPLESTAPLLEPGKVGPRMDFDTEMIVKLHWREVPMRWIPTRVSYPTDGISHFRMFFDNARMTSLHIRLTLGMLIRLPMLLWRKFTGRRALPAQVDSALR
jgi:glycosyltransferase involved in cell wall biosynthesis